MEFETLQLTVTDAVARLRLNRPDALNAISAEMGKELRNAFNHLQQRDDVRAILLTGAGRAFSAGGDIKQMRQIVENPSDDVLGRLLQVSHEAILAIREIPKPVIAAVNGYASGAGFSLAIACDYRIAGASARLNLAFVRIGLVPDFAGTFTLPRLIGWAKAAELMMTGRMVEADQALRLGLFNQVVPDDRLTAVSGQVAARFAAGPTVALGRMKQLLNRSASACLREQLEAEKDAQVAMVKTADFVEGVRAFIEKREPKFQGK